MTGEGAWLIADGKNVGAEVDLDIGCMVNLGKQALYYDKEFMQQVLWTPIPRLREEEEGDEGRGVR